MSFSKTVLTDLKLETWQDLYALSPAEVIRRMDDHDPSVAPSDAFLAVVALRSLADLESASRRLEDLNSRLNQLTWALAALAAITLVVALIALFK